MGSILSRVPPCRLAGAHGVLQQSATALAEMADAAGLAFVHTNDVRQLPASALEHCRVLALFTIGETPWSDSRNATRRGGPCQSRRNPCPFGVHSATDSCHGWPAFGSLIRGAVLRRASMDPAADYRRGGRGTSCDQLPAIAVAHP